MMPWGSSHTFSDGIWTLKAYMNVSPITVWLSQNFSDKKSSLLLLLLAMGHPIHTLCQGPPKGCPIIAP